MDYCGLEKIQTSQQQENELNNRFIISAADLWGEKRKAERAESSTVRQRRKQQRGEEERWGGEDGTSWAVTWVSAVIFVLRDLNREGQQVRSEHWFRLANLIKPPAQMKFFGVRWALDQWHKLILGPLSNTYEIRVKRLANVTFYKVQMHSALTSKNKVGWIFCNDNDINFAKMYCHQFKASHLTIFSYTVRKNFGKTFSSNFFIFTTSTVQIDAETSNIWARYM